jgi:hypothetical protein
VTLITHFTIFHRDQERRGIKEETAALKVRFITTKQSKESH